MSLALVAKEDGEFISYLCSGSNKGVYDFVMNRSIYVKDGKKFLNLLSCHYDYEDFAPIEVTLELPTEDELNATDYEAHEKVSNQIHALINFINSKNDVVFNYFGEVFGRIVHPPMLKRIKNSESFELTTDFDKEAVKAATKK